MADTNVVKRAQRIVIIPESIEYPTVRVPFTSGAIAKGDRVRLIVRVIDKDGNVKSETIEAVIFKEYPASGTEVQGAVKMAFFESTVSTGV
jgi:hypothetical protein